MTLIDCFTESHIDNIATCLRLRPDKMIMVGNVDEMRIPVTRYKKLLQRRQHTEIVMCDVRGKDFGDICVLLDKLVREESECVIDLTGGNESVIMAVGAVLAGLDKQKRQNVRIEKLDRDQNVVLDCVNDNRRLPGRAVDITVEELIILHGGCLYSGTYQPSADCSLRDLAGLWSIVSEAPKAWNRAIMLLNEFESRAESRAQIRLLREQLRNSISNYDEKERVVCDLLEKLQRRGIIDDQSNRHMLEYTYKSPMLRYCTLKAGNVLEVKTLLEGRSILEDSEPLFQDCRMSVSIDWDGIVHNPVERIPETRNEIDVILMHRSTPLFISCKNGNIGEEELYKLHTVATRFGGSHARKMLVAAHLDQKTPAANRAFIQRAWDMDILLVKDAAELSREEWQRIFKQAVQ